MRSDLKALADAVIQAVRVKIAPLVSRLNEMDGVIKALPESLTRDLDQRVKAAVEAIPRPKDGEDGMSVTVDDVAPVIAGEIAKAMQAMPAPRDGESVTVEQLSPLVEGEVAKAVAKLPAPRDGKDADPEQVAELVAKAVQALPAPKDGETVSVEQLVPVVKEEVAKAVAVLPAPRDGKDADPEHVAELVAKAVGGIPRPRDGLSITPEDVAPMLSELVGKAVAEMPRPKDGESIPAAEVQRMVDEAVTKAVQALPAPKGGEAGRDALQLELQPCIDMEKSYPRGTYARHAGGLWRAFEATKALRGWECVVEGIADLRIEQDGRQFTLVARTSSGEEVAKSVKVAALVDRGVFKMDEPYEAGDGVTWGGSFFIAQKDGPGGRPGEPGCDGWRLAVKRGRDGTKGVSL